jgi:hypothetical protein
VTVEIIYNQFFSKSILLDLDHHSRLAAVRQGVVGISIASVRVNLRPLTIPCIPDEPVILAGRYDL